MDIRQFPSVMAQLAFDLEVPQGFGLEGLGSGDLEAGLAVLGHFRIAAVLLQASSTGPRLARLAVIRKDKSCGRGLCRDG